MGKSKIPGVCVCVCVCGFVCVMAVKMACRSGESVNTALAGVCVSMAFFPSHYVHNLGKECLGELLGTSGDPEASPLSSGYTLTPRI